MPVTLVGSKWSSGSLIFYNRPAGSDARVDFGEDGSGLDVKMYGDTASCYFEWDQSADILKVVKTSAAITGSIAAVNITQTMTAVATANQVEVLQVKLIADVKTGAWAQAIFAQTDYSTDGLAHGAGSVICAELSLPGSSVVRGTYYVWQSEIDCPANCAMNGNPIGVMSVSVWGTNKSQFDDVGLLFDISGVTSGALKFWYDNTDGAYDEWLKVRTPGGIRYIPLMDGQAA